MTTFSDDFNRTDDTTLGANWTNKVADAYKVSSNTCVPNTNSRARAYHNTTLASADHSAEIKLTNAATLAGNRGVMCRYNSTADTGYSAQRATNAVALFRFSGATYTLVGSTAAHTWVDGDVVKIEANGSTIKVYVNGVEKISQTDTTYTGTQVGIDQAATNLGFVLDDFAAADLAASATIVGVVAPVTTAAPAGAVSTGANTTVVGVAATATAAAPAGTVSTGASTTVIGAVAPVTTAAPAGTVAATRSATIVGPADSYSDSYSNVYEASTRILATALVGAVSFTTVSPGTIRQVATVGPSIREVRP